jgi:hypothetical protein
MNRPSTPVPPRPELERRPCSAFGWLEAELLHDGWLAEVGPNAVATLVLLALAADRRGASFFSRDRMAGRLGISRHDVDSALQRLLDSGLVDHRPWRPGVRDGVWQLLPPPTRRGPDRALRGLSASDVLRSLGFGPP